MPGRGEDLFDGALLNDLAEVHDGDTLAEVAHGRQVVADEEEGDAEVLLEFCQECDERGPGAGGEDGGGFVEHDKFGVEDERAGDGDALERGGAEAPGFAGEECCVEVDQLEAASALARWLVPGAWIVRGSVRISSIVQRGFTLSKGPERRSGLWSGGGGVRPPTWR